MGMPRNSKPSKDPRAVARPDYFEVANYVVIPTDADSPHAGTEWVQINLLSRNPLMEFAELPVVVEFNNMLFKKVTKTPTPDGTHEVAHFKKIDGSELARAVRAIYIDPNDLNTYPGNLFPR